MKTNRLNFTIMAVVGLSLALLGAPSTQACGPGGATGSSPKEKSGTDEFTPHTGNERHTVQDLQVWGGVGECQLAWVRYSNSRFTNGKSWLGTAGNWRHCYQWEVADAGTNTTGDARVTVYYPDGQYTTFTQVNPTTWLAAPSIQERIFQDGAVFTLQRDNGWQYHFTKYSTGSSAYYQLNTFTDSQGNVYTLSYDTNKQLARVTEPAGRSLQITYQTLTAMNGTKKTSTTLIAQVQTSDGRNVSYGYTPLVDAAANVT